MGKEKRPSTAPAATEGTGQSGWTATPRAGQRVSMMLLGPFVFCCGGAIMAIEIVGVRLLAPHFGVSVYVWGSILTVFMAALATGYWLGGKVADAHPSFALLNVIVLVGAGTVVFVPYLSAPVGDALKNLGQTWGPLWCSCVLFYIPSMLLATVSPFAVRLVVNTLDTIGGSAGRLYALSTVGSIVGSGVTTFILIGACSLTTILLLCVAMLGALAAINLALTLGGKQRAVASAGVLLVCMLGLPDAQGSWKPGKYERVVEGGEAETPYHRILIVEDSEPGTRSVYPLEGPTLNMHFDKFKESGIFNRPPYYSTSRYTDAFHLVGAMVRDPKRSAFIGAGGGLGPRTFRQRWPQMSIDVVDIDPKVLEFCEKFFHLRGDVEYENGQRKEGDPDPLMTTYAADGRIFIADKADERDAKKFEGYDIVVLDAFTIGGRIPWHLVTQEYFAAIRRSLTRSGVLVMNVIGSLGTPPARAGGGRGPDQSVIAHSIYKTMHAAFSEGDGMPQGYVYIFPVNYTPRMKEEPWIARNLILIAGNWSEPLPSAVVAAEAAKFDALVPPLTGLGIASMATDMLSKLETDVWLADAKAFLLTDEFCPVETMPFYGDEE